MRLISSGTAATATWVTLPLEGARSSVYSDLRETVGIPLATDSSPPARSGAALVAATAAVLARYAYAEEISIGISRAGNVAALVVAIPAERGLGSLVEELRDTLDRRIIDAKEFELEVATRGAEGVIDRNPLFGVLVILDGTPVPDLRQDVTLGFDPGTGMLSAPDGVVVSAPALDQDPSFGQGVEDLPVQELVAHRAVEGLTVAIFPWAVGCNVERFHADLRQPLLHGIGDKFRAIV